MDAARERWQSISRSRKGMFGKWSCIRMSQASTDIVPFDLHTSTMLADKLVEVPRELDEDREEVRNVIVKPKDTILHHDVVLQRHRSDTVKPPKVIEWLEMRDPESLKVYYHNKVTGKSVWSKPEGFDDAVELPTDEEDDMRNSFWIEVQDSKGRTYYYDLLTRETRWDRPNNYDDIPIGDLPGKADTPH